MASDPMEVEVYQPPLTQRPHRKDDNGVEVWHATLATDSLSAAIQRLGWAAAERDRHSGVTQLRGPEADSLLASIREYEAALAEVRRLRPALLEGA